MAGGKIIALLLLLTWLIPPEPAPALDLPYYFYSFEGTQKSPFPPEGIQVRQGFIKRSAASGQSGSFLVIEPSQPHGAVALSGRRLIAEGLSHLEIWTTPSPSDITAGGEFLDFDGAAVALFRSAQVPDQAEFYAFHFTGPNSGSWISSGVVTQPQSSLWHRLGVIHDWSAGTWNLEIDGRPILSGLGRAPDIPKDHFELWLFGQIDGSSQFDDILITPVAPARLETLLANRARHASPKTVATPNRDTVAHSAPAPQKRRQHPQHGLDRPSVWAKPKTLDAHIEVVGGGRHLTSTDITSDTGESKRYAFYSPGYDDSGKPLPLQVQIRSDGSLANGRRLRDLHWSVTELPKKGQILVPILIQGTFATGPVQTATVPSTFSNKALNINVWLQTPNLQP
jgi:hypothetical protein